MKGKGIQEGQDKFVLKMITKISLDIVGKMHKGDKKWMTVDHLKGVCSKAI